MKKDYHYTIARTDRICLISFVIFLMGWELIKKFYTPEQNTFTYISPAAEHLPASSPETKEYETKINNKRPDRIKDTIPDEERVPVDDFENQKSPISSLTIMTATPDELISIGFSRKVAFNIKKYVAAGGIISNSGDLLKLYGMDSIQFKKVLPHIIFASKPKYNNADPDIKKTFPSKPVPKMIDLNQSSTEQLESLVGIGPVLAERIVKFRTSLGGFISIEQLKDCYGLPPETYEIIKDQLEIKGSPQPLFINKVNLDSLSNPYLNKKMIWLIKAYKKQHGPFKNEMEFRKVYPADSTWCNKILPYISFDL